MLSSFWQCREGAERRRFDMALVLLGRAADRDDRTLSPTSVTAGRTELDLVLRRLLDEGLIEEIAAGDPEQAWRSDGEDLIGAAGHGCRAEGDRSAGAGERPHRGDDLGLGWAVTAVIDIVWR